MLNTKPLFNPIPALFVKDLHDAIAAGFCVTTSVDTFPYMNAPCYGAVIEGTYDAGYSFEGDRVVIEDYDDLTFVFKMQDAINQGYRIDDSVEIMTGYLKRVEMTKVAVVEDKKEEVKPTVKGKKPQKAKESAE